MFPCICTYHQERLATILAVVLLGLDLVQVGEELIPLLVQCIVHNWEIKIKSPFKNPNSCHCRTVQL